ncbi:transcriptional regulator, Crp/Fnr family protein [Pedobacter sp. BAL39]|uniref:Crp/Fnr family transcriptional regulator n=1 Tax=Pedobacter sp. BAL39 TaxID=391596 RepID=UPI00015596A3|nr:Crp/Fnr family transcriptional regulator [Pedobacter sp. BAL39]EDM38575.1 transcriptional regulator, Crp/Fnr family protein [Pedobacter sp. BAL39]
MITEQLLKEFGAKQLSFEKGEILFRAGDRARCYHQIILGSIKMNNFNDEGKEFVQGIFNDGESFGEPPLLMDGHYPANAVALARTTVYQLGRPRFLELLRSHPEVHLELTINLAKRLYYKSMMASEISSQEPEHRILKLIDYYKERGGNTTGTEKYKVEITRQQIADLTGLRVETVIRSVKSLEKKGALSIINRKIFR